MLPPICAVCSRDFSEDPENHGGLVEFEIPEDEEEWDEEDEDASEENGPDYVQWFCRDHVEEAEKYTYLPAEQAVKRLKKIFNY